MFEIFETLAPENEERLPDTRVDKIKASVLSRIEEDKPMKKHFTIKPLLIAAAITATGAISALSAGAVTTPAISDETLPAATVAAKADVTDTPAVPENDPKPDTTHTMPDVILSDVDSKPVEKVESPDELAGRSSEDLLVRLERLSDMEFLYEDSDGVSHYKSSSGKTVKVRLPDGDDVGVVIYYYVG